MSNRKNKNENKINHNPRLKEKPPKTVIGNFLKQAKKTVDMITINHPSNRLANKYERTEIDALIFYTARENKIEESFLRNSIYNDLDIKTLDNLNLVDYTKIRSYLWEKAKKIA